MLRAPGAQPAGSDTGPDPVAAFKLDRWDARSKAIISRAEYIRRHTECPTAPTTARVETAGRGPDGAWLVRYVADGAQLTDYWFYLDGRWLFDLPLSNPAAVRLYKMPGKQYLAALGCSH